MNKFAQSLGDFSQDRKHYFEIHSDEKVRDILKTAATTVLPSLTPESIQKYVIHRINSELNVSKGKTKVSLNPTKIGQNQDIKSADGQAIINIGKEPIIIPFKIIDGEISDFTKIIVSGKSFPYNRNILSRLEGAVTKKAQEDDPYIGTAKQYTADTDRGFMEDAIQIRDEFSRKNNYAGYNNGNRFVYASTGELFERMLEKVASISPVPEKLIKKIENDVRLKIADTYAKKIEKIATEVDPQISHIKDICKKIDELPLKSIKDMKNGQKILFPEKVGTEISMVQGVVFKELKSLGDFRREQSESRKYGPNFKKPISISDSEGNLDRLNSENAKYMIISSDGRIALISDNDDFLALEDNNGLFKLPSKVLQSIRDEELFIPIIKDTVFMPQKMIESRPKYFYNKRYQTQAYGGYPDNRDVDSKLAQLVGNSYPFREIKEYPRKSTSYWDRRTLLLFPKGKFDTELNAEEKIKKLYGEDIEGYLKLKSLGHMSSGTFLIDGQTKVLPIKGFITGYFKKKGELKPGGDDIILKFASDNFMVTKLNDGYAAKTVGSKTQMLGRGFNKNDITRMMKILGYDKVAIGKNLAELETKGKLTAELPLNANINKLYEGKVENKTKSIVKKVLAKNFNKKDMKRAMKREFANLGATVTGSIAADNDTVYHILDQISKLGNEAEGCSVFFEKLAVERRNHDLQDIAMACALGKNLCDFVKEAYDSDCYYRGVKEACEFIEKNAAAFDDLATKIVTISDAQFENGNEIIPYSAMKTAMDVLGDTLYIAQGISKVANDAPQDFICKECGAKVDKPLKDGKCDDCIAEEMADKTDANNVNSYTNPAQEALDRAKSRGADDYNNIG